MLDKTIKVEIGRGTFVIVPNGKFWPDARKEMQKDAGIDPCVNIFGFGGMPRAGFYGRVLNE